MKDTLPTILWLWIPLAIITVQAGIELFVPQGFKGALHSESGPHETLQFIFALIALVIAFRCLFSMSRKESPFLIGWVACFVLGCAYISGEEVSWGQHIFEWGTPEFWSLANDQNETNLHNTSSWLDQKPRLILLIGTIVGGLVIPFLLRFKASLLPEKFKIIYPTALLAPTAAIALSVKIIDKVSEYISEQIGEKLIIFTRPSEVEELYLFYFVLLYLVILRRRIMQR